MERLIILLFLLASISGIAATHAGITKIDQTVFADSIKIWDKLNIQGDPKINDLLKQQAAQNKKNGSISGYRLQIYFGSGENAHTQAIKIKTDFLSTNSGIKTYLLFKSPDFIVRIGDFRTKSEALKLKKALLFQYPNAFIVADEISLPDLVNNTIIY